MTSPSLAEQNKDFRLELLTRLFNSYEVKSFLTVPEVSIQCNKIILSFNKDNDFALEVNINEEQFLRLHEQLCTAYIHLHDEKARTKLNEVIENLKV